MMHVLLIAVFLAVYLRDAMQSPLLASWLGSVGDGAIAAWSIGSMLMLWLASQVMIWSLGRRIDRTGRLRHVQRAETVLLASRIAGVFVHAFNTLALGWIDVVRHATGNLVGVDEVLAATPVLLFFVMGWWSIYPIDRRLREAVIVQELDHGRSMPPILTRWQFISSALRHQALWIAVPMITILAWGELTDAWTRRGTLGRIEAGVVQFVGVVLLLLLMPLIMRRLWDTIPLATGPLRDRLLAMCASQRVRVANLLIWRTHGAMVNGAVIGLIPRLRFILLTDALIEYLSPEQVEAVTAHEIGHVRRRHILWLGASALGSITVLSWLLQLLCWALRPGLQSSEWVQGVIGMASLGMGLVVFGFVSRRFEWQADAFAVQHLSGLRRGGPSVVVTPEAVAAMTGALNAVAYLNHIPKHRFTWRHGTIATRLHKLSELPGLDAGKLPIDRTVRWIILAAATVALAATSLVVWSGVSSDPERPRRTSLSEVTEVLGAIRQDARDRERLHLS